MGCNCGKKAGLVYVVKIAGQSPVKTDSLGEAQQKVRDAHKAGVTATFNAERVPA